MCDSGGSLLIGWDIRGNDQNKITQGIQHYDVFQLIQRSLDAICALKVLLCPLIL